MIEGKVYQMLKEKLVDYLYDFDRHQFELSVLNGTGFRIKNCNIKPGKLNEILDDANAPINIKSMLIRNLKVQINKL